MPTVVFVLVFAMTPSSAFRGIAVDHISGYQTLAACQEAGKALADGIKSKIDGWACIPGPSPDKPQSR